MPILHCKKTKDQPWPTDKFFYYLTKDGLFKCRNAPFFTSAVKVWPFQEDLADQKEFLTSRYPLVPQWIMELTVGFFKAIADRHDTEAIVLLVWNEQTNAIEPVIPKQWAHVWETVKGTFCGGLNIHYETPTDLPPHLILIGDIHSHVDIGAHHSGIDDRDEAHKPAGVHIIIGRVRDKKPHITTQITADGERFDIGNEHIIEGYESRNDNVPEEWFQKFSLKVIEPPKPKHDDHHGYCGGDHDYGHHHNHKQYRPKKRGWLRHHLWGD